MKFVPWNNGKYFKNRQYKVLITTGTYTLPDRRLDDKKGQLLKFKKMKYSIEKQFPGNNFKVRSNFYTLFVNFVYLDYKFFQN